MRVYRLLKRFKKSEDGATAIEFGLIAIPLFFLLMAIIELSLVVYVSSVLDGVVTMSARYGITGNDYAGTLTEYTYSTREELIEKLLREQAGTLFNPDDVRISTTVLADITSAGPVAAPASPYGTGGQAVLYTVEYDWQVMTPFIGELVADKDGIYKASASIIVQNEEF